MHIYMYMYMYMYMYSGLGDEKRSPTTFVSREGSNNNYRLPEGVPEVEIYQWRIVLERTVQETHNFML